MNASSGFEVSLSSVGLTLSCDTVDFPRVLSVSGPAWDSGQIFTGDVLQRAAGVNLRAANADDVKTAFGQCRAGESIQLTLVTRARVLPKTVLVPVKLPGGRDVVQRRTYGTGAHWKGRTPPRHMDQDTISLHLRSERKKQEGKEERATDSHAGLRQKDPQGIVAQVDTTYAETMADAQTSDRRTWGPYDRRHIGVIRCVEAACRQVLAAARYRELLRFVADC